MVLPFHPKDTSVGWNPLGNTTGLNSIEMSIVVSIKADAKEKLILKSKSIVIRSISAFIQLLLIQLKDRHL